MIKSESVSSRILALILVSATLSVGASMFPTAVAADTTSVRTQQLLPTTGNSCVPLSMYGFTPYLYEGALHSFEFTVTDDSYVAISGAAGGTRLPFNVMTRWRDASGALRIHVDVQTTTIQKGLGLSVTLLSAKGVGQPICVSVVSLSISPTAEVVPIQEAPTTGTTPATSGGTSGGSSSVTSPRGEAPGGVGGETTSTSTPGPTATTSRAESPSAIASLQDRLFEQCAAGGAFRLWIILLVIYVLIMVPAVFGQLPAPQTFSPGQRSATILVPFALIIVFWYAVESCRASLWMPVTALVIALLGLLGVYRNDPRVTPYIARVRTFGEGSKPKETTPVKKDTVIITPPPTKGPGA